MLKTIKAITGNIFSFTVLILFFVGGCSNDDNKLTGVISYNFQAVSTDVFCYVFLDTDTDITNGYTKRVIIPITSNVSSVSFEIDTSDVPAGSYYLLGAYDFSADPSSDNTDPGNPLVWEAQGWFGSTTTAAPASANITDLNSEYNFTLYGLG